jgi:toxin secretion/phage lysis holin
VESISIFFNLETLEVAKLYLFGPVKFLDLLILLMVVDVITGIFKAWKLKDLRSRNALFGYARKIAIFGIIIVANIVDRILDLNGMVATATVLFYMVNEVLSIVENAGKIGLPVPQIILDKLQGFNEQGTENKKESE